ncbi:MAG: FecR family protein [Acidobacteriota bacterium]|nr:FecR family protein [Acidobacteriota bacterium]
MPVLRSSSRLSGLAAVFFAAAWVACAQTPGQASGALPAPGSGEAKLVSFTGQISVLRDNNPWALNLGDLVEPQQVIVTGSDGYGVFKVSDGSTFEVFPKSRVVFRQNRGDWKDLLEVWLGKVRVQIEHPGGLPNNNRVRTSSAVISVRGTIFDVEVEDEDGTTLVLDEEGQVEVRHLLKVGEPKILNAQEYIRVYKNEPIARKLIDKGSALQRAARAASDALYQVALNAARGGATTARTAGASTAGGAASPADTKNGNPAPSAPPPAPSAPPAK